MSASVSTAEKKSIVTKVLSAPEVYCIDMALPDNPLRNLNVYVVRSGEVSLVVDTGFNRPECREALRAGLEEIGVDLAHTSLFLTHLHSDHTGLVQDFVRAGCTVYMNKSDYEFCNRPPEERMRPLERIYLSEGFPADILTRQGKENQGRAYAPEVPFPAVTVGHGTRLRVGSLELVCLHTPGHTPGHTVLYMPEGKVLFSGDHVLFDITPNISVWDNVPHSLADYLDSLEYIRTLSVEHTFPAHRSCTGDVYTRLDQLIEHHHNRLEELYGLVKQYPDSSAYTLAGYLTWSARGLGWDKFPPHQKWFAMGETLAHLRYLADEGRIVRLPGDSCYRYRAAEDAEI